MVSDASQALLTLCVFMFGFIGLAQIWPRGGGASAEHVKTSSGTPGFLGIRERGLVPFFVDDRLFTLVPRHLIGQLGTVIVSLLTDDLPFKHVYPLHINSFSFAALVFSAAVFSLKVNRLLHDALFSRPRTSKDSAPWLPPQSRRLQGRMLIPAAVPQPLDPRTFCLLRLLQTNGH